VDRRYGQADGQPVDPAKFLEAGKSVVQINAK